MADTPPPGSRFMWYVVALIALLLAVLAVMFVGSEESSVTDARHAVTAGEAR